MSLVHIPMLILATVSLVLAATQMAQLRPLALLALALAIAGGVLLTGEAASRTSLAEVSRWLSDPQRRLDLSALLLLEALLFGSHAVMAAQGGTGLLWRIVGGFPPPSMLLALFFGQVAAMLTVDGMDYGLVSWVCATTFGALFAVCVLFLRWLLPDQLMRSGLRIVLHVAQAGAGLWLARPAQGMPADPAPAMWGRLGVVAAVVFGLMALGWLWQRRSTWNR
ncbi:hypothetical protein [Pollutimonas bauzanensis]|uniref:Uncharacterized protein n=1 Tax=Pollutimonas bauzanensis TaxID=658167 RepID=A0A1M5LT63_9BURK|nr:hypothetical protein [Pollutimonas bauzanensis]SHG68277.1 hypothetical protein SAMN04488135_10139 [Pollutimonas bauzanensis]